MCKIDIGSFHSPDPERLNNNNPERKWSYVSRIWQLLGPIYRVEWTSAASIRAVSSCESANLLRDKEASSYTCRLSFIACREFSNHSCHSNLSPVQSHRRQRAETRRTPYGIHPNFISGVSEKGWAEMVGKDVSCSLQDAHSLTEVNFKITRAVTTLSEFKVILIPKAVFNEGLFFFLL